MKKTALNLFSLILATALTLPSFASALPEPYVCALIFADEDFFSSASDALPELSAITKGNIEITDTFNLSFIGFGAKLPEKLVKIIDDSEHFDAHVCGYFSPLEVTENNSDTENGNAFGKEIYSASDMINLPYDSEGERIYTGAGTVVAVIDDGFDISHEVFASFTENPRLTEEDVYAFGRSKWDNFTKGAYVSEKIPFAFNYAKSSFDVSTLNNHGTHVAAIIAGKSEHLTGVAPDAQLLLMKVFDDSSSNASEIYVLQALEDAALLGADVINLSIGTYSGFSDGGMISSMSRIARRLENSGITVVCAAGNDAALGADFENTASKLPLASAPDYGTVNFPGSVSTFLSVASAQNTMVASDAIIHSDGGIFRKISYSDTNAELGVINKKFIEHFDSQTLEYVLIPGIGSKEDYTDASGRKIDVSGKLVLVQRGVITFSEKVNTAAANGAVGVIVYNSPDGDDNVKMDISGCRIPAVFISAQDGEYLFGADNKTLIFDTSLCGFAANARAYAVSSFSSYGTTPDLKLKPDLTAVGESVYSAAAGGRYTSLSGTSMAAPFVSGAAALLCEKLELTQSKYISSKRPAYIRAALMNTAIPLKRDGGAEYSPRRQGAGLIDIGAALEHELLLTDSSGNPSVSLKDGLGDSFEAAVLAENITDSALKAEVSVSLLCDLPVKAESEDGGEAVMLNSLVSDYIDGVKITLNGENISFAGTDSEKLTIEAGESAELVFGFSLDSEKLPSGFFENGFFIDGFITLKTDIAAYSIPLTGFYGDFSDPPAFDLPVYGDLGTSPFLFGNALAAACKNSYPILGSNDLTLTGSGKAPASRLAAFSPDGDGIYDSLSLVPSLLRNVNGLIYQIRDSKGSVVYSGSSLTKLTKSSSSPASYVYLWDGRDGYNTDFIFPDGGYTAEVTAVLYDGSLSEALSLPFSIDTKKPYAESIVTERADGRLILEISAFDNIGVRSVKVYSDGETVLEDIDDGDETFVFDITEFENMTLWADITDYAANTGVIPVFSKASSASFQ